jgi:hypothetical protein
MKLYLLLATTLLAFHQAYSSESTTNAKPAEMPAEVKSAEINIEGTEGALKDWKVDLIKTHLGTDNTEYAKALGKTLRTAGRGEMRKKRLAEEAAARAANLDAPDPKDVIEERKKAIEVLKSMTVTDPTEKVTIETAIKTMERVNMFQQRRLEGGGHGGRGGRGQQDDAVRKQENEEMSVALVNLENLKKAYPDQATHLEVAIKSINHSLERRAHRASPEMQGRRAERMKEREDLKAILLAAATPTNKTALEAGWTEADKFCRPNQERQ